MEPKRTQILLLGCNTWKDGAYDLSDAILAASVEKGTGKLRLASILRDIHVDIPGHGRKKINAALPLGGPELALRVLNGSFGLAFRYYAVVDMLGLVRIIDLLGGIDIEITEVERVFLNCWVRDLARQFGDGVIPPRIEKAGMVHMDGRMALSHARNRTIGTDFARSDRQRAVLRAMAKKIREETGLRRLRLLAEIRRIVRTNLPLPRAAALALAMLRARGGEILSFRVPVENTYRVSREGEWHFEIDTEANAKALRQFLDG